jgi:cysteinyl-tRNA synthetase
MEKGSRKYGKTVWELAQFYTDFFFRTMDSVNVLRPTIVSKATDHIAEMIEIVQTLIQKGVAYETTEAVYFDVTTFPSYGKLSNQPLAEKMKAVRDDVYADPNKKHPADFALWFKRIGRFKDHTMHWDSPWGDGFPGWHIECSAMSMKYLGKTIDIHSGGIDHIPVHHENEIAQSEAANGVAFVHYWIHYHHLHVDGQKMSKSLGNFYTIDDIEKKGIHPMGLRLLFLQSHYRQPMNFTWKSVEAADEAYRKLKNEIGSLQQSASKKEGEGDTNSYSSQFKTALSNDLQTPQALAVLFTMMKSDISSGEKLKLITEFDAVLGLKLLEADTKMPEPIPDDIQKLAQERAEAKQQKNFARADELRVELNRLGYAVKDSKEGYVIEKN